MKFLNEDKNFRLVAEADEVSIRKTVISGRNYLADTHPIDRIIDDGVERWGFEYLAWYRSFHFTPNAKWGVYISDWSPYYLAKKLKQLGYWSDPTNLIYLGNSHPIVVMNTCKSAVQGYGISDIQGWVTSFLKSGASSFIGTLWSVSEESVLSFTQALYKELKSVPIGEAVRNARRTCKKDGDPSWLAFVLFGHPNATIKFGT